MRDSIPIHLATVFLLIELVIIVIYLWERLSVRRDLNPPRIGMIISALIVFFGAAIYFLGWEYGLLAFVLATAGCLSLFHPVAAASFFIACFVIRPWELMPPNPLMETLPRLVAAVAFGSWFVHRWQSGNFKLAWNSACSIFVALVVWIFLSAVFSGTMDSSLEIFQVSFFPIVAGAFLIFNSVSEEIDLRLLQATIVISIVAVIVIALYVTWQLPVVGADPVRLTGIGLWENSNDLAALIVLVLPLLVFPLFKRRRAWSGRLLGILLIAALGLGLWLSQSRGAILSLFCGGLVYTLWCSEFGRRRWLTLLAVLVVPVLLFVAINRGQTDLSESSVSRWNYLIVGLRMVKDHPLLGVGVGNYETLYERYSEVFHEWGRRTAHSSWILVLAETGAIGLLLLGALFGSVLYAAWRLRHSHPELLLSAVCYGVAMSFLSHTYLLAPYLLMAFVLAASRVLDHADQSSS